MLNSIIWRIWICYDSSKNYHYRKVSEIYTIFKKTIRYNDDTVDGETDDDDDGTDDDDDGDNTDDDDDAGGGGDDNDDGDDDDDDDDDDV